MFVDLYSREQTHNNENTMIVSCYFELAEKVGISFDRGRENYVIIIRAFKSKTLISYEL